MTDSGRITATIDRLVADKCLPPEKGACSKDTLAATLRPARYVLFNLGVHLTLGGIFAFDVIPLPMGAISGFLWTAGNRIFFEITRDHEKRKVHSLPIIMVSIIPWIGYFAYTIPLKKTSEDAAYLFANHITYKRNDTPLIPYLEGAPGFIRKLIDRLIIPD